MTWTIEYVDQANTYGGCHWIIRDKSGHIHARFYDEVRARALLAKLTA